MEFQPTEYVRKPFGVKAEEITYENIEAIAEWCKGRVDNETSRILGAGEVKLPVVKIDGTGEDAGRELVARLGYFIVQFGKRFRVYKPAQFRAAFDPKPEETEGASIKTYETDEVSDDEQVQDDNSSVDGQETVHVSL